MGLVWAKFPTWLKYLLAAVVAASLAAGGGYLIGKREGRQQAITERLRDDIKA
ncbi:MULTISPECIES: hypothetical protein [Brucella/Ochrobactrum group]|jgi:hypothetical protein|uniref:hypothetical protein n=1 Tax=Brucella/Ochrobactrum group TaxID=2826938 RepID=UPI001C05E141|nr:hypothetical protein [Brucella sp. NBRC 12950]QWK80327.1 hypothetical protein KMS41_18365 [Ochrobactrum sp. BTU1]